jgi:hypothetical protein
MLLLNTGRIANSIVSSPSDREQLINLSFFENNFKKNEMKLLSENEISFFTIDVGEFLAHIDDDTN